MAVEVCHDAWKRVATLYDNTTDTAFGPIFTGPVAGTEAEDFLEWLRDYGSVILRDSMKDSTDARSYTNGQLTMLIDIWRRQYVPDVPEPQSLKVPDMEEGRLGP